MFFIVSKIFGFFTLPSNLLMAIGLIGLVLLLTRFRRLASWLIVTSLVLIAVADAMGVSSAGIFGDILCARMKKRNVAALVTDGVVRDRTGVLTSALPVWCAGVAAPASVNGLTFVGWQQPIGCGGCAIFPGDVIVADDDGAVVIPQAMVEFVAREGAEHELYESWVFSEVENGVKLPGLYPPDDDAKARYAAWRKSRP